MQRREFISNLAESAIDLYLTNKVLATAFQSKASSQKEVSVSVTESSAAVAQEKSYLPGFFVVMRAALTKEGEKPKHLRGETKIIIPDDWKKVVLSGETLTAKVPVEPNKAEKPAEENKELSEVKEKEEAEKQVKKRKGLGNLLKEVEKFGGKVGKQVKETAKDVSGGKKFSRESYDVPAGTAIILLEKPGVLVFPADTKAITPDGQEVDLGGWEYSLSKDTDALQLVFSKDGKRSYLVELNADAFTIKDNGEVDVTPKMKTQYTKAKAGVPEELLGEEIYKAGYQAALAGKYPVENLIKKAGQEIKNAGNKLNGNEP